MGVAAEDNGVPEDPVVKRQVAPNWGQVMP